jgi:hypothetical protein
MHTKIIFFFLSVSIIVATLGILKALQAPLSLVSTVFGIAFFSVIEACIVREAIKKLF